ncbi:hypothetical protein BCR34DRAFT_165958 [Clohesyomyces aquaticus]|uniref:Uncharacterized protein n=1 Tax=Clohesyomyces aquaticus TaxID=1231657 RepID=A0A1Y1YHG0_9PLEO|nr:hypothetical protein BCR34DRAFT_165958 [Clohesyomyces aquaticus]
MGMAVYQRNGIRELRGRVSDPRLRIEVRGMLLWPVSQLTAGCFGALMVGNSWTRYHPQTESVAHDMCYPGRSTATSLGVFRLWGSAGDVERRGGGVSRQPLPRIRDSGRQTPNHPATATPACQSEIGMPNYSSWELGRFRSRRNPLESNWARGSSWKLVECAAQALRGSSRPTEEARLGNRKGTYVRRA